MTAKKTSSNLAQPKAKRALVAKFPVPPNADEAKALADLALRPSVNAAVVLETYTKPLGEQDLGSLVESLDESMGALSKGDLTQAEAMLYGQAHALQAIFMNFSRRAMMQDSMPHLESFLRMALKAQSQCRMTLETLATIKNPPVVLAKQANINHGGQQQVNNGMAPKDIDHSAQVRAPASAHTMNFTVEQTELLEASHGQRLDTRAQGQTSGADPRLEAVGKIHRAKN